MLRAVTNSLLSLLLLTMLVWGGCISCEQYFMFGGAKSCCAPDGHCTPKAPTSKGSERECNQIAFDHHRQVDSHIELPIVAAIQIELPVRAAERPELRADANSIEPSPPDLQILHSTFLI